MRALAILIFLFPAQSFGQHGEPRTSGVYIASADGSNQRVLFPYRLEARSLSCSPDGTQIAYTGPGPDIYVVDMDGSNSRNITNTPDASEFDAEWSPDGKRIAYSSRPGDGPSDVLIQDLETGEVVNATQSPSNEAHPTWSPDGSEIAFASNRNGNFQLFTLRLDTGEWTNVINDPTSDVHYLSPAWSPDGSQIALIRYAERSRGLVLIDIADGSLQSVPIGMIIPEGAEPSWSVDSTRISIATWSRETGDLYVFNLSTGSLTNITNGIGTNSVSAWTADDRVVFTSTRPQSEMTVDFGAASMLIILEGGGLMTTPRSGDTPAVVLRRQGAGGKTVDVPLTQQEAEGLLRRQGIKNPDLADMYRP